MKLSKTTRECMYKHSNGPKEFSEITGMSYATCKQISCGRKSRFDTFAPLLDWAIQRGWKGGEE